MTRTLPRWLSVGAVLAILAIVPAIHPMQTTFARPANAGGHACAVYTGSGDSTFTRNFNPFGTPMDFTKGGIYEPLYIITTAGGGHRYPWLATKYKWSADAKTLLISLRRGVTWSDGKPFTSADVVFTYTAGKINKALIQGGIDPNAPDTNIASIKAKGPYEVAVSFKKKDVTVASTYVSNIWIIPQHIWSKQADPTKWTNPNPVGTGPFTVIKRFGGQDYIMGKNPHYWMKGAPHVSCIERVYSSGNDASELMMVHGDIDWTGNFVPNVQKVYVSHDPAHYHYYYATNGTPVGLFYDLTKFPWSLKVFREAVSMAIDRKSVSKIGEYGYAPASDPIGVGFEWPKWVNAKAEAALKKFATLNPSGARALLEKNGFTYKGSQLVDPHGDNVTMELNVISGWNDWTTSLQIIQKNLQDIGIDASVKLNPDYNSWSANADKGAVYHLHWTYGGGPTPYGYFYSLLDKKSYVPSGQTSLPTGNWMHFWDPTATNLLKTWAQTPKVSMQHAFASKLQQIFVDKFPFIPLFIGPNWYTYSTKNFVGWPSKSNAYALAPAYNYPDWVKVITTIKPVK